MQFSRFPVLPGNAEAQVITVGDTDDALAAPDDPATNNNGMQFTTKDQDNDMKSNGRCDSQGWWFNSCRSIYSYK